MLLLGVRSEIEWIQETARIPVLGGIFLFLFLRRRVSRMVSAVSVKLRRGLAAGLHTSAGSSSFYAVVLPRGVTHKQFFPAKCRSGDASTKKMVIKQATG